MKEFTMGVVPICWLVALVGWIWLVVIGVRARGWWTGIAFLMTGFLAMVYGYRQWRKPSSDYNSNLPFAMMVGGLLAMISLTILSSFL